MRKLIPGLIAIGLLAAAGSAKAQMADPLGLITFGAVIPYVGASGIAVVNSATGALTATFQSIGSIAILEVSSPIGSNAPPEEGGFGSFPLHMFFFDQACLRQGPSVGNPPTPTNAGNLLNLNLIGNIPQAGLIAAAAAGGAGGVSDVLDPLGKPIHARVYWINASDGALSRVLEPISIRNPELFPLLSTPGRVGGDWNPLRTGATFVAPLESNSIRTILYLVCPTTNIIPGVFPEEIVPPPGVVPPFSATTAAVISSASITIPVGSNETVPFTPAGTAFIRRPDGSTDPFTYTGTTSSSFTGVTGIGGFYPVGTLIFPVPVTPIAGAFPHLAPTPVAGVGATPLFVRIYDDEENFRRNVDIFCRCWGAHPVVGIDPIYANADPVSGAPRGTYNEVEGQNACIEGAADAPCSFTGYRSIQWGEGAVGNDVFGRLSNGNRESLRGATFVGPIPSTNPER
jgi:hypothetical protein